MGYEHTALHELPKLGETRDGAQKEQNCEFGLRVLLAAASHYVADNGGDLHRILLDLLLSLVYSIDPSHHGLLVVQRSGSHGRTRTTR